MREHIIHWPREGWTCKRTMLSGYVVSTVQLPFAWGAHRWETLVFRAEKGRVVDWSEVDGEPHPDEGSPRVTALRIHAEYVARWTS